MQVISFYVILFFMLSPVEYREPHEFPTFHELQDNAQSGLLRRATARYLIPRNYDRSIRRHERLGTPIIRKVVLFAMGRYKPEVLTHSNYALDKERGRLESSVDFALRGSVRNERIHMQGLGMEAVAMGAFLDLGLTGGEGVSAIIGASLCAGVMAVHGELVALQRYNRARLIKRADEELAQGAQFSPGYTNEFGIDERAYRRFLGQR